MIDIRERFGGESTTGITITAKDGFLGGGEEAGGGFGLNAVLEGRVGRVGGGRGACGRKVDFRLASTEGQLHFARRRCCVLIDGIRVQASVIVLALVVQRLNIKVCDQGARDGGRRF